VSQTPGSEVTVFLCHLKCKHGKKLSAHGGDTLTAELLCVTVFKLCSIQHNMDVVQTVECFHLLAVGSTVIYKQIFHLQDLFPVLHLV